jgi:hypothetical protein
MLRARRTGHLVLATGEFTRAAQTRRAGRASTGSLKRPLLYSPGQRREWRAESPAIEVIPAMFLRTLAFTFVLGISLAPSGRAQSAPQPPLPTVKLTAGFHVITAETATTGPSRSVGMMFRERIPPNGGMLFVFDDKLLHCFWMRNTPLPLSIAFLEDDGTIVQVSDMAPKSDASHCPPRPIRFALEMEQGWFAKRGIVPGAKIGGLPPPRR